MNLSIAASFILLWIDDSNASQKVGQLLISPSNFFKSSLGNLTWEAEGDGVHELAVGFGDSTVTFEGSELPEALAVGLGDSTVTFEGSELPEATSVDTEM